MTKIQFGVIVALLLANVVATAVPYVAVSRVQPEWTYMIESPKDEDFLKEVTESGRVGWELVFARRALNEGKDPSYELIYKRPR